MYLDYHFLREENTALRDELNLVRRGIIHSHNTMYVTVTAHSEVLHAIIDVRIKAARRMT